MAFGDFSFTKFTQHPFYTELNARLVELAGIRPGQVVVDLACGTGAVTRLIRDKLRGARDSVVIGVDHSASALRQAAEELQNAGNNMVQFIQGQAENVSEVVRERVDAVFLCNAIHMFQDKARLVTEVSSVLREGGVFAFNSAFFEGSHAPETEVFYRRWMFRALRLLRSRYGLAPTKREKVESRKPLSAEQYKELLEEHGFQVKEQRVETAPLALEAWQDISGFEDFIAGALPGVPLDKASAALKEAAAQVFEELKLKVVPRNWLAIVAVRHA